MGFVNLTVTITNNIQIHNVVRLGKYIYVELMISKISRYLVGFHGFTIANLRTPNFDKTSFLITRR